MTTNPPGWKLTAGVTLLAAGLVVAGMLMWLSEPEAVFGWFSSEPLSGNVLSSIVFMTGRRSAAVATLGAGLLLLAAVGGFPLGRRAGRRGPAA